MRLNKFLVPAAITGLVFLAVTVAVPTLARQPTRLQAFKPLLRALKSTVALDPSASADAASLSYVSSTNWPVLLIRGFNGNPNKGSHEGSDCKKWWSTTTNYLKSSHPYNGGSLTWKGPVITVGYYRSPTDKTADGDINCNVYLNQYSSYCKNYYAGNEGSNDEAIYHLSCELSWYIWNTYSSPAAGKRNVQIVGYSMGGLIARYSLYQGNKSNNSNFPPGKLYVQDIVTFGTPHGGFKPPFSPWLTCQNCEQAKQMSSDSPFIKELYNGTIVNGKNIPGQNPQGAAGTDWTMIGSKCDVSVTPDIATYQNQGRKSFFTFDNNRITPGCVDHFGYVTDASDVENATTDWCNLCDIKPTIWNTSTAAPHSLRHMLLALYLPNW